MATMTYVPLTELDAVNVMLEVIGERPVNAIDSSVPESEIAQRLLHNVSREVQSAGLNCNTEEDYTIALDGDNKVPLADNILRVDGMYRTDLLVRRGGFLYDKYNQVYTFTTAPKLKITWFLPFTDLPQCVREYICIRAARKFQKRLLGSDTLDAFTEEDEYSARALALAEELDTGQFNILNGPDQLRMRWNRGW